MTVRHFSVIMINLFDDSHKELLLSVLRDENQHELALVGGDGVPVISRHLWIISSMVRSILQSLDNLEDVKLILPEFSRDEISKLVKIFEMKTGDTLDVDRGTMELIEMLGVYIPIERNEASDTQKSKSGNSSKDKLGEEDEVEILLVSSDSEDDGEVNEREEYIGNSSEEDKQDTEAEPDENIDEEGDEDDRSLRHEVDKGEEGTKCAECGAQFANKHNLLRHIQSKHGGIKYSCTLCEFETAHQTNLQRHIQSEHEGIKYPCNQCGQQFTQQRNLLPAMFALNMLLKTAPLCRFIITLITRILDPFMYGLNVSLKIIRC